MALTTTTETSPAHPPAVAATSCGDGRAASASHPRLVADIGGTNARFGWIASPGAPVSDVRTLPVPAHAGPAEAAQQYLADLAAAQGAAWRAPRHAAFAVATAVAGDRVAFTNSHWDFSREAVRRALGLEQLLMLNDFEALALSLPCLGADQLRCPDGRLPHAAGAAPGLLAVVGPGTGLGVGAVVHTRQGWVALPGEGGHATLAAGDDLEAAVIAAVRRRYPHVSAERLLSGIGLPLLHQALGEVRGQAPATPWTAEAIVNAALGGQDALADGTLDLFCALLGSFAGNVALTLGARGGVYIGGGIVPRFADRFFASAFRPRFEAKGRFQGYLAGIPTALITDTLAALSGGALAIEQQVALG
ncbi:glucokinase [Ideonella sp. DXS22W]|uniref:Glucokinase n=1 Tax=Pseudaquabacterium inlustre TaxID=2984192 RepID=A0ABU9CCI1_9BURK